MRSSRRRRRRTQLSVRLKSSLRVSSPLRVLPSEPWPQGRSLRAPLMGFWSLQHMQAAAVHSPRAIASARYGPPSGFGYPLGGFLPPRPGRPCFMPAALVGFVLRSVLLPQGAPTFPATRTHIPFLRPVFTTRPKAEGRLERPGFLGFHPCRSPSPAAMRLAPPRPVAPLDFRPSGSSGTGLGTASGAPPLTRFPRPAKGRATRRPRVSIGPAPGRIRRIERRTDTATLMGFACLRDPRHSNVRPGRGNLFASRRVAHCCRLTGDP